MSTTQWIILDDDREGVVTHISDAGRKRLSDEELRKAAAENARRIQSSCIYEISAGAGFGGMIAAIVWMLVRPHMGM